VTFRLRAVSWGSKGIVAKRRDSRYHSGLSHEWIKVKNRAHPSHERGTEQTRRLRSNQHA
jgi:ATP-dependent DNA ligase